MSGLEMLGAVAGGSQLVSYIFGIGSSIIELQDHIKNCPARIRSYSARLESLSSVIQDIENNEQLCAQITTNLLDSISKEVDALKTILKSSFPAGTRKSPAKYLKIPKEKKAEKRIIDSLATLDAYKLDLVLRMSYASKEEMADNSSNSMSNATSMTVVETRLALRSNTADSLATTITPDSSAADSKPSTQMPTPEGPPEGASTSQGQARNESGQYSFTNVTLEDDILGTIGANVNQGSFEGCAARRCTVAAIGPIDLEGLSHILKSGVINNLPIPAKFKQG